MHGKVTATVRSLAPGATAQESGAAQLLRDLSISAADAREVARGALAKMRNGVAASGLGSVDLLWSLGSLWFQQDSLRTNYETLLKTPGAGNPEALAGVWSSSIGAMGLVVETAGLSMKILRPDVVILVQMAGKTQSVAMGVRIAQWGGALIAIAGVMDGVQYAFATRRVGGAGDESAGKIYRVSALTSFVSAGLGIARTLFFPIMPLGPIGTALVLGLSAKLEIS